MKVTQHHKPLVFGGNLHLKQRPNGQCFLTGRFGAARIVIRPLDTVARDGAEYGLFFGEPTPAPAKSGGAQ